LAALNGLVRRRLAERAFTVELASGAREFLLNRGVSREYGARELKRVVHRRLLQPLARLVRCGAVEPDAVVRAEAEAGGDALRLEVRGPRPQTEAA
jgi:ATP-dependent Clp protease ATP-binding subunit ClpA